MSGQQMNKDDYATAQYLMYEYPCHLVSGSDELNVLFKDSQESSQKRGKSKTFFDIRTAGIKLTTKMYWIMFAYIAAQLICFAFGALNNHDVFSHWPVLVLKLIGIVLLWSSGRAWYHQLWKEEEFYGWALGNYSREEPIYRILGMKDENENAKIIAGDWLKNRPSIIFLLIVAISCLYLQDIPYLNALLRVFPNTKWFGMLVQILISIIFFIWSFPCKTDWIYLKKNNLNINGWRFLFRFLKCTVINPVFVILFGVLFILPLLISFICASELAAILYMILLGVVIYLFLLIVSFIRIHKQKECDKEITATLKDQSDSKEGLNCDKLNEQFGNLSCKGQMAVLTMIQNQGIILKDWQDISKLTDNAHSPHIAAVIQEISYMA